MWPFGKEADEVGVPQVDTIEYGTQRRTRCRWQAVLCAETSEWLGSAMRMGNKSCSH